MHGQNHNKHNPLPVILYRCEAWSFTLREEHRLGMFESRVLRKTFGHNREKVKG